MKRLFFSFTIMCALSINANSPITYFSYGEYLGLGHYHNDTGGEGDYPSYVQTYGNGMNVSHVLNDKAMKFNFIFNIDYTGFFNVDVASRTIATGEEKFFSGNGYCQSTQCHYFLPLGSLGYLEETITFHPGNDRIYKLGSIHFVTGQDGNGNNIYQKTSWEEAVYLISSNSLADEDEEENER